MLPLTVVALGGNALAPPRGDLAIGAERAAVATAAAELATLARDGARLLVVHGNGPQVGRLLAAPGLGDPDQLDVHVAQTQGELGYLLAQALDHHLGPGACVALVTRVLVDADDPALRDPRKPVGPVLAAPPAGVRSRPAPGGGWRRVVPSPRPLAVVEASAIGALLARHHVVAGGGGGVPLAGAPAVRRPLAAVVDKDWVAALLATALDAEQLVFVTDVPCAYEGYGGPAARPLTRLSLAAARAALAGGAFAPGSMAPKVESAADFAAATGRRAVITTTGAVAAALAGTAGTTIAPDAG